MKKNTIPGHYFPLFITACIIIELNHDDCRCRNNTDDICNDDAFPIVRDI